MLFDFSFRFFYPSQNCLKVGKSVEKLRQGREEAKGTVSQYKKIKNQTQISS